MCSRRPSSRSTWRRVSGPSRLARGSRRAFSPSVVARRRAPLKAVLLDQRVVAGIGNIYADEALWHARLHPLRPAAELEPEEVAALRRGVRLALRRGIERQGANLGDGAYPQGSMQDEFRVYGRTGEPCRRCRCADREDSRGRARHALLSVVPAMSVQLPEGVLVGHWTDRDAWTGCTVVLLPDGNVASCEVRGGAPGALGTAGLSPASADVGANAILLTGGSAFGLGAADGVVRWHLERGRGWLTRAGRVPIVAGAVVYDLALGDSSRWPTADDAYAACEAATATPERGSVGVGTRLHRGQDHPRGLDEGRPRCGQSRAARRRCRVRDRRGQRCRGGRRSRRRDPRRHLAR